MPGASPLLLRPAAERPNSATCRVKTDLGIVANVRTASEPQVRSSELVGLRSFNAVMDYAARNNWTEQMLVDVCKKKFGRVRQGVGVLRERYRELLAQSNDALCHPADSAGGAQKEL